MSAHPFPTDDPEDEDVTHVAVVGIAGRFPGAADPSAFWRNVAGGVESVRRLSEEEMRAAGVSEQTLRDPDHVPWTSSLDGLAEFDADYFGMTPREAAVLDPQHRLLLQTTQHVFDDAGYDPYSTDATTGVYVGVGFPSYLVHHLLPNPEVVSALGTQKVFFATDKGFAPTRIAYHFGFTGPAVGVDTACSTSLVAVHQACRALLAFDCDAAVAGGASAVLPDGTGYQHVEGGVASPDGHCRAFDADAGGTVFGSGVGLVLLKRLDDAVRDGDHVHAVILGSAVNNDGSDKAGFTAPSVHGQAAVVAEALAFAGVSADTIGYVEAHGTGTVVGDPIEIAGLTRAYRRHTDRTGYCAVGSVKTNVGHLDVAAGVTGLIKCVLALRHAHLPPSLNFYTSNPAIDFAGSPFRVGAASTPWESDGPRRAAVSAFGIGGTNGHVVLEQALPRATPPDGAASTDVPFVVSARTPEALERVCSDLAERLSGPGPAPVDVARTLALGRHHHVHRRSFAAADRESAVAALTGVRDDVTTAACPPDGARVAFVFPGQGGLRAGATAAVHRDEPVFRDVLDRCAAHAHRRLGLDIRDVLHPRPGGEAAAQARIEGDTRVAQPCLYAVCLGLAELWRSWGVTPSVLLGHSFGEYVAAVVAGAFDLEAGLDMVIGRAELTGDLPPGAMVAVCLPESELATLLGGCELAAVNGPDQCVATGPVPEVEALEARLAARGADHRRLPIPHAFHSAALDGVLDAWRARIASLPSATPGTPVVSSHTGSVFAAGELTDPGYWARQLRGTVRFADAVRTVAAQPDTVFLEIGPVRTLAPQIRRGGVEPGRVVSTGPGRDEVGAEWSALVAAVGAVHCSGVDVAWPAFWGTRAGQRVPLPGYPFERTRHWIDRPGLPSGGHHFVVGRRAVAVGDRSELPARWLLVGPAGGTLDALEVALGSAPGSAPEPVADRDVRRAELVPDGPTLDDPASDGTGIDVVVLDPGPDGDGVRAVLEWTQALAARADPARLVVLAGSRSAAAGLCRVAATARPEFAVTCLDSTDPADVVAEVAAGLPDPVVDLADGTRRLPVVTASEPPSPPDRRSTELVGDLSLAAVADLARAAGPGRLTLVDTGASGALPDRATWGSWLGEDGDGDGGEGPARAEAVRRIVGAAPDTLCADTVERDRRAREPAARATFDRAAAAPRFDRYCAALVHDALTRAGVDLEPGRVHTRAAIAGRLRLRPVFERFLDFLLTVLVEDGLLRRDGEDLAVLARPGHDAADDRAALRRLAPQLDDTIGFVEHCARHLPDALSGDRDAVGVLFPDGDPAPLERAFTTLLEHSNFRTAARTLGAELARMARATPGRPLRVLEIGAGSGQLTRVLAEELRGHEVHYTFTDVGPSFVRAARGHVDGYRFARVDVRTYDVSLDPVAQGFEPFAYDAVVGFDVVHATPRIADTTALLRDLVAPGGRLGLVEAVRSQRWVELLWGLAEDWWSFTDTDLRTTTPLIGPDAWDRVLGEQGFAQVVSVPRDPAARADTDYALLLARQSTDLTGVPGASAHLDRAADAVLAEVRGRLRLVRELEAAGARVEVRSDDEDPGTGPGPDAAVVVPAAPSDTPIAARAAAARRARLLGERGVPVTFVSVVGGDGGPTPLSALLDGLATDGATAPASAVTSVSWDGLAPASEVARVLGAGGRRLVTSHDPGPARVEADRVRAGHRARSGDAGDTDDRTDVDRRMVELFRELFGIGTIGPHDDFGQLGGDSLLASQAVARVRRLFEVDITVGDLFRAPTPAALAAAVHRARDGGGHADVPLERVRSDGAAPLSRGQESLWLTEQINGPGPTYNIPGAVRLVGDLDVARLRRALAEVLRRHEVLRTTVGSVDGQPVARVRDVADVPVELEVRVVTEEEIGARARDHAREVFDLAEGPLIRTALLQVGDGPGADHVLLVNVHHIVADGWSLGVLVQELVTLYSAFAAGHASPLPELEYQYTDFARWQRRWLEGPVVDEQVAYWRRQLAGLPPLLELPTDRPRPDVQRIRGAVHRFTVPPEVAEKVRGLGRDEGATLFMVLLSAFTVLLGRHTGTEDVAVGTTNANRTRAAFEQMIGMFVNNLVLRADLGGRPSFRELVARVRATAVDAYAHQDLPFLTLVDELRHGRSPAHSPLFQVLFLVQKLNITVELPGITAQTIEVDALHTKFDLTLFMEEQEPDAAGPPGIAGTFVYNAELFDEARIARMAEHLLRLLACATTDPDARIDALGMETDDEMRDRTVTEANTRSSRLQSLRSARRRSVEIADVDPVRTGFLPGLPDTPALLTPGEPAADLPGWLRGNAAELESLLHRHGAVLLRGFGEGSVERFDEVASAICPTLFPEYGDLPREGDSTTIYKSTPYPANRSILFHNESSHLASWPMRQFFSCLVAAESGGETPLVDCRAVYAALRPQLAAEFRERGLRYVRNFIDSVDVSWQRFYGTDDPDDLERRLTEAGIAFEWSHHGTLRTWRRADAVLDHPHTGETVFFNQLALHHASCLDVDTRRSLVELYGEHGLPRNVHWGDGAAIPDEVVEEVRGVMRGLAVEFRWQEGDVLVLDNMLVAHARKPFTGSRKVVVALGSMMTADEPALAAG